MENITCTTCNLQNKQKKIFTHHITNTIFDKDNQYFCRECQQKKILANIIAQ